MVIFINYLLNNLYLYFFYASFIILYYPPPAYTFVICCLQDFGLRPPNQSNVGFLLKCIFLSPKSGLLNQKLCRCTSSVYRTLLPFQKFYTPLIIQLTRYMVYCAIGECPELIYFKNAIEVLVDTLVYDALQLCNSLILVHDISCYWLTSSYLSFRKT